MEELNKVEATLKAESKSIQEWVTSRAQAVQGYLSQVESFLSKMAEAKAILKKEIEPLRQEKINLENDLVAIRAQRTSELEAHNGRVKVRQNEHSSLVKEIESKQIHHDGLNNAIRGMTIEKAEAEKNIGVVLSQLSVVNRTLADNQKEVATLSASIEDKKKFLGEMNIQIDEAKKHFSKVNEDIQILESRK